jgi:hypothetical protein
MSNNRLALPAGFGYGNDIVHNSYTHRLVHKSNPNLGLFPSRDDALWRKKQNKTSLIVFLFT